MKVRSLKDDSLAESSKFNIHSVSEIIVYWPDETDTDYMNNYEVFIDATQQWMTFSEAFADKHIITDNYNTCFFEPANEEDRQRGYTL